MSCQAFRWLSVCLCLSLLSGAGCGDEATSADESADALSRADADQRGEGSPSDASNGEGSSSGLSDTSRQEVADASSPSDSAQTPDSEADSAEELDSITVMDVLDDSEAAPDASLDAESVSQQDASIESDTSIEADTSLVPDVDEEPDGDEAPDVTPEADVELGSDAGAEAASVASACTPSQAPKPLIEAAELTDFCALSPCQNGASCENHPRSYTCHCQPGDYGVDCALSGGDSNVQWSIHRYGLGGATYMPSLRMDSLGYLHIAWSGQALEAASNGAYASNQGAALMRWRRSFDGALVYPILATDALAYAHASGRTESEWYGHVSNNPVGAFNGNLDAHSHEQRIEVGSNYKVRYFMESDSGEQAIPGSNVYLKLLNKPIIPKELLASGVCQNGSDEGSACFESSECDGGFCSQSAGYCPSDGSACGHAASSCPDEVCLYNDKFDAFWTAMTKGDDLHFVIGLYALGETTQHIFYTTRNKGESKWSYPIKIESIDAGATTPSLALDGQEKLHVAFDGHDGRIYYTHNVEGTWSAPLAIDATNDVNEHLPSLAVAENGSAHVVWVKEDVPGGGEEGLLLEYAQNVGGAWSAPMPLARIPGNIGTQWGHNVERVGLSSQTNTAYVIFGSESQGPFPGADMFVATTTSLDLSADISADTSVTQSAQPSAPQTLELCWEGLEVASFEITDAGGDGLDTIIERIYFFAGAEQPLGHLNEEPLGLESVLSAAHLALSDGTTLEGVIVDNRIMFGALGEELTRVNDGGALSASLKLSTHPDWPETPALHLRFSPSQDIVTMGESSQVTRDGSAFELGPLY